MRILVTGGAGYVGCRLVPALIADGHEVTVYDMMFFGSDGLPIVSPRSIDGRIPPRLALIEGDIRETAKFESACRRRGIDCVIHMACISNDPSFALDESLSRTMNYECFEPMVVAAKRQGVKRFIYASTSSVYGISQSPNVTEDHPLVPLTLYNKYKGMCEPLLFKHKSDDFVCVTLRPSTLCGYSPRQRLDLSVNILTNQAVNAGKITVFGGAQMRPSLHIDDMVDVYKLMLEAPAALINGETFNVGAGNLSIMQLAELVRGVVDPTISIGVTDSLDTRSYQVNSDKIRRVLGYVPKRSVEQAVADLVAAFRAGKLPGSLTDDRYFNVQRMRKVWADLYKSAPPTTFDPVAGHMSEIDLVHRAVKV